MIAPPRNRKRSAPVWDMVVVKEWVDEGAVSSAKIIEGKRRCKGRV